MQLTRTEPKSDADHGLGNVGVPPVVSNEASPAHHPSEASLHDPAAGQDMEAAPRWRQRGRPGSVVLWPQAPQSASGDHTGLVAGGNAAASSVICRRHKRSRRETHSSSPYRRWWAAAGSMFQRFRMETASSNRPPIRRPNSETPGSPARRGPMRLEFRFSCLAPWLCVHGSGRLRDAGPASL
jgi:hypothetical protein